MWQCQSVLPSALSSHNSNNYSRPYCDRQRDTNLLRLSLTLHVPCVKAKKKQTFLLFQDRKKEKKITRTEHLGKCTLLEICQLWADSMISWSLKCPIGAYKWEIFIGSWKVHKIWSSFSKTLGVAWKQLSSFFVAGSVLSAYHSVMDMQRPFLLYKKKRTIFNMQQLFMNNNRWNQSLSGWLMVHLQWR